MRGHMRISRVMAIEREGFFLCRTRLNALVTPQRRSDWAAAATRCATPPSFNRIRKPVGETDGRAYVARYTPDINVDACVQDAHVHYKFTRVRVYAGALPYGEADKPGEPTRCRCFTRQLSSAGCTSPRFCVKARHLFKTVFIFE